MIRCQEHTAHTLAANKQNLGTWHLQVSKSHCFPSLLVAAMLKESLGSNLNAKNPLKKITFTVKMQADKHKDHKSIWALHLVTELTVLAYSPSKYLPTHVCRRASSAGSRACWSRGMCFFLRYGCVSCITGERALLALACVPLRQAGLV